MLQMFTGVNNVCMEGKTVTIALRVPPEMRDKLQKMADEQERTLSWFCMKVLRDFIQDQEKKAAGSAKRSKD